LKEKINPFLDKEITAGYEKWYQNEGQCADKEEKEILQWLIDQFTNVTSIIEIGCGTGHFSRWFESLGLNVTAFDISMNMIGEAKKRAKLDFLIGDAGNIPIASKSFDLVTFITTLEFLEQPEAALIEAKRIAIKGMILGVINKNSRLGKQYKQIGGPIWDVATFYTPKELKKLVSKMTNKAIHTFYRTTLWQKWNKMIPLPWGGFIGMGVRWESDRGNHG